MAAGQIITDYLAHGSGAPSGAPSLADDTQMGLYVDDGTGTLYAWNPALTSWSASGGGGSGLSYHQTFLGADVGLGYQTWTGLLTLTLPAGTYLISANILVKDDGSATQITARLWDGSSTYFGGADQTAAWNFAMSISGVVVVLTESTTLHLDAWGYSDGWSAKKETENISIGNKGTWLTAVDLGGGGSATGTSVLLNYIASTDLTNVSVTANTWTDSFANQSFTVPEGKTVVIFLGGCMHSNAGSDDNIVNRLNIDDGGTITGTRGGEAEPGQNFLAGIAPVVLTGLAAGAHTVKHQLLCHDADCNFYCRAAGHPEFENFQIVILAF